MHKYSNIFLDLDDTLYDFSAASREAFMETYNLLAYDNYFDSFEQFMAFYEPRNKELWQLYGKGEITKKELNRIRYSYPLECVGIYDAELAEHFCHEALGRIPTKKKIIPGAIELLEYLHSKYRLFILSNGFKELQAHKMRTIGIDGYFSRLILSEDIGVNKPRPELFLYALECADANPANSIMIGDMFDTDIAGAAGVGMDQIFFNRKRIDNLPFKPTYEVSELAGIKEVL